MNNKEVAQVLAEISELLELAGENPFKVRAYAQGARLLETHDAEVGELIRSGGLQKLKGIGNTLAQQITEFVQKGTFPLWEELKSRFPIEIREMLRVPGLGPKKVKELVSRLGIRSLGELEYACHENRLLTLPGFGKKSQENILRGIDQVKRFKSRFLLGDVQPQARALLAELEKHPAALRVSIAGSLRRRKETVKDIDLVAESDRPDALMDFFIKRPPVEKVLAHGPTKSSVVLRTGIQADLRVVEAGLFPYALHHFTGSREHHTALRARAKHQGYKLNEYGLFQGERLIPCLEEADIYRTLGLSFIPPELREDWGEIEAAEKQTLPVLVEEEDLQGSFHFHTFLSDGTPTPAQWIEAAGEKNLRYLGISDHSQSAYYAGGLKPEQLREQQAEIALLNKKQKKVHLFWGIESDILPDGSLDYGPADLGAFDFVIASVHSRFTMSEAEMTRRIVRALENPYTTMLGHPTGRLLLAREAYAVDMEQVLEAAARHGVLIELNANPHRLDLDWRLMKKAKQLGLKIAINPDAHHREGLEDLAYGVGIARKGWLEKADVFNTLSRDLAAAFFRKRKQRALIQGV
jgi:DNA polymerase (family 10)